MCAALPGWLEFLLFMLGFFAIFFGFVFLGMRLLKVESVEY